MSIRQIRRRIESVARRSYPPRNGTFTLEELCRHIWREDREWYLAMAEADWGLRHFQSQFESEAAAASKVGYQYHARRP